MAPASAAPTRPRPAACRRPAVWLIPAWPSLRGSRRSPGRAIPVRVPSGGRGREELCPTASRPIAPQMRSDGVPISHNTLGIHENRRIKSGFEDQAQPLSRRQDGKCPLHYMASPSLSYPAEYTGRVGQTRPTRVRSRHLTAARRIAAGDRRALCRRHSSTSRGHQVEFRAGLRRQLCRLQYTLVLNGTPERSFRRLYPSFRAANDPSPISVGA